MAINKKSTTLCTFCDPSLGALRLSHPARVGVRVPQGLRYVVRPLVLPKVDPDPVTHRRRGVPLGLGP